MPSVSTQPGSASNPAYKSQSSVTARVRPDGTHYRSITPLEAIYYHERLDLVTHPLIKGLIKWKWDNYTAKYFYLSLALELVFLIIWTCTSLIVPFPIRYVYRFPQDIWRCVLWAVSIGLLLWAIVRELFDIRYARKRYEDYVIWETARTRNRIDLISKKKYKSNTTAHSTSVTPGKSETLLREDPDVADVEHATIDETTGMSSNVPPSRSHHSQHHPLPATIPALIRGRTVEPQPNQQPPIDAPVTSADSLATSPNEAKKKTTKKKSAQSNLTDDSFADRQTPKSAVSRIFRRFQKWFSTRVTSYYMYYSLNNLFDWIVYILCFITTVTHAVDIGSHTVTRARVHMYIASITVICLWFRFMVFFRTITISAKTLRSKLMEIKLGELVIMVSGDEEKKLPTTARRVLRAREMSVWTAICSRRCARCLDVHTRPYEP